MQTPYEQGNQNQTTDWAACIEFYQALALRFPRLLQFSQIGISDAGVPIHAGVVSADGVFDREQIQRAGRPVFFNNNGIHPGEPEGIDACMALVRDLCLAPERLTALGSAVYLFIPIYNVDGCLNRNDSSRVNQDGPESFGFRGNSQHLDLNRDFIKCDSLNAQLFNQFFSAWDPDVMVDTHTSNGADYSYTMTLIHTQADKLGRGLGRFLRESMLPAIYLGMEARGWPTCPYVNPFKTSPDQGIADFLDGPRFSTGYAALHHTIGFMPETHMLKPFADRYASMRALLDVTLQFTVDHGAQIRALRKEAKQLGRQKTQWPVSWKMDESRASRVRFKGYAASYRPSLLGNYQRLAYDREQPWERDIDYYTHFVEDVVVPAPQAYVVPQAWRAVTERLAWNGVQMERLSAAKSVAAQVHRIQAVQSRPTPYEGHMFHEQLTLQTQTETAELQVGDYWIPLQQDAARYIVETLEPLAHDSFFRWGFFNSVLEKKERFSDYVFEDMALQLLKDEPELKSRFEQWRAENPALLSDQSRVLGFIFENCKRFAEPAWRRYPVLAIF
ncbi:Zinc carboxypeptidase [Polaromonas sp. OV174]|uniref:M14 family zinc carboxypeptidase n=1 Tax=Polaromonas sp. OV174 TaxID=1855300 RepID=UPI0008EFD00B|nr:M14 family zinc carboxypeptidase [Polaromonas sp. OV174]SFC56663.1 Zinc carboxypeptidase [Polaromonas sp. OV174]